MVAMTDDTAKGKVIINKTDAAGHAESGLYEIATYKNGEFGKSIKYYLVETKTLDGYTLDSTRHEIVFEYVDQNTPVIEVTKDLTNKEKQPEEKTVSCRSSCLKTGAYMIIDKAAKDLELDTKLQDSFGAKAAAFYSGYEMLQ